MGHTDIPSSETILPASSKTTQRRQRRGKEIRSNMWCVRASDAEAKVIERRAVAAGVSVPRLLVSLGTDAKLRSGRERKVAVSALVGVGRTLAGVGNNLNQLAYHANAMGELPEVERLDEAIASVEVLRSQLESVLAEVEKS